MGYNIVMDHRKAFDLIHHKLLMAKLSNYDINHYIWRFFEQ